MNAIPNHELTAGRKKHKGLHTALHIDMTPLVDLSFLLISFFTFTTTMSQPNVTRLFMPKKDGQPTPLKESEAVTVILGSRNKAYVYQGRWEDALSQHQIQEVSYSERDGIGKMIHEKQVRMGTDRDKLTLLIKPTEHSTYKNLIDALDETNIHLVKRYAIVDAS